MTLSIIANNTGPIHTRSPSFLAADGSVVDTSHMLDAQLIATHTFTSAPPLDILILPGGFGSTLLMTEEKDGHITDFVASRFHHTDYVISVCTGAGFLARAGVLEGRRATTNKAGWAGITQHGRNITWIPSARWVQDGKVWTSSGVSAGMDMMVAFLRHVYGDPIINDVVNVVEYAPHTDPTWDPFSVVDNVSPWLIEGKGSRMRVSADKKRVPGANMSRSLVDCVSPLEEYPDVS
ncbi:class I glutamine amidotransferase-like protein [Diplogelasinospora grovesii]|uniref:Class I glutamine amidotransferase-like protein n=1 Tax=Diplogelasinospora grovesii TaxID=303347 RepID=A0AAN6RZW8_9PEZI|nr:class I glutamine amidotransferase-like protein [Diplogelasinospora grovesii]